MISRRLPRRVVVNPFGCERLPAKSGKYENSRENDCRSLGTGSTPLSGPAGMVMSCWAWAKGCPAAAGRSRVILPAMNRLRLSMVKIGLLIRLTCRVLPPLASFYTSRALGYRIMNDCRRLIQKAPSHGMTPMSWDLWDFRGQNFYISHMNN